jgi:CARDB protein
VSFLDDDRVEADPPEAERPIRRDTRRSSATRARSGARRGSGGSGGGSQRPPRPPRRTGGGGAGGGAAAALQRPAARIILAIAFIVVLIIVITLVVQDCQRSQLVDSYRSYVNDSAQIARESSGQGQRLFRVLSNPNGQDAAALTKQVRSIEAEARSLVQRANDLSPPGKLDAAHRSLVTALQYRVSGLDQLQRTLKTAIENPDRQYGAQLLADPMQTFLASDVIYEISYAAPAAQALKDDNIEGVEIPAASQVEFISQPNYAGPAGARSLLAPLTKGKAGGVHGVALSKTTAVTGGKRVQLSTSTTTTLQASSDLKWEVSVQNQGDFVERNVEVDVTFQTPGTNAKPVVERIPSIDAGKTASVTVSGPPNPELDVQASLRVDVKPVIGEKSSTNNGASYPVKLTLGG